MKVKLIGYSRFMSKKGSECLIIGFCYNDDRWNGYCVDTKFISPSSVTGQLVPGNEYVLGIDLNGRIISVTSVK